MLIPLWSRPATGHNLCFSLYPRCMAQEARTQGRSIVSVDWLRQHIDDPDVVVLCASMGNPIRSHQVAIPGAIVADLESDLSDASN